MTANVSGSAKIYNFPARGRFAEAGDREDNNHVVNFNSPRVPQTVLGSAWYHDEAVRDEDPRRKN